jgi:hypothetical protein
VPERDSTLQNFMLQAFSGITEALEGITETEEGQSLPKIKEQEKRENISRPQPEGIDLLI